MLWGVFINYVSEVSEEAGLVSKVHFELCIILRAAS